MLISLEGRNELNNFVFSRSSRQYRIQSKKIIKKELYASFKLGLKLIYSWYLHVYNELVRMLREIHAYDSKKRHINN